MYNPPVRPLGPQSGDFEAVRVRVESTLMRLRVWHASRKE